MSIVISNVRKRFGPVLALADVSLTIEPGERVGLVGSNGSGKSTLLRAIVGLLRIEGRVTVAGADVSTAPEVALRTVAYMPQLAPPLDAPVAELVRAWAVLRDRPTSAVRPWAEQLGLELDACASKRLRDLSGGMKQKLLAALALAADAPVLICDEPTASLDAGAREAFFAAVNARKKSSTLVLCSHRVDEVRHLVDRVVELKEGRVERDAPVGEVLAAVRGFRVEVAFHHEAEADAEAATLEGRGFRRLSPKRFFGAFAQAEKVEVVSSLTRTLGPRLADLSVLDAESLHENVTPLRRVS